MVDAGHGAAVQAEEGPAGDHVELRAAARLEHGRREVGQAEVLVRAGVGLQRRLEGAYRLDQPRQCWQRVDRVLGHRAVGHPPGRVNPQAHRAFRDAADLLRFGLADDRGGDAVGVTVGDEGLDPEHPALLVREGGDQDPPREGTG